MVEPTSVSRALHLVRGPRLQVVNLAILYGVVLATVDYPNPPLWVAGSVLLAAGLDAVLLRFRPAAFPVPLGGARPAWTFPWGSTVATMGIWLLLDGNGPLPFVLLPMILVGSKHLIRTASGHLLNANNLAACALILAGAVRVGVNDWGAAPQTVALMLLFGTIATLRAKRFLLAFTTLAWLALVYGVMVAALGYGGAAWFHWAFAPVQVMMAFFAVTDPATSPSRYREQAAWSLLYVLLTVPATLAGRPEAPVFALLLAAPQRHLVAGLFAAFTKGAARASPSTVAVALPQPGTVPAPGPAPATQAEGRP